MFWWGLTSYCPIAQYLNVYFSLLYIYNILEGGGAKFNLSTYVNFTRIQIKLLYKQELPCGGFFCD